MNGHDETEGGYRGASEGAPMNEPTQHAALVDLLAAMPGTVAVVLGGSHALGCSDAASDLDFGVYYRGAIDLSALAAYGVVHPPGSWGRLMNGGAWLRHDGRRVDVILRDLDVVDYWTRRAGQGEFEVDALLGYLAGVPTYLLAAELASCRPLRGTIPTAPFPSRLAASAPERWRFCRTFSIDYARAHARRGNVAGAMGQAAKAVMEEAHAVVCEREQWVCNEKRLIEAAGLSHVQERFAQVPVDRASLVQWVDLIATQIGMSGGDRMPWA